MNKHKRFIILTILFTFFIFDIGLRKDEALAYRTKKYVELNKFKPNTIILGGSRVHYLNPKDLEKYTQDRVYNLGLQFGTLEEQYYFLKHSLENFRSEEHTS